MGRRPWTTTEQDAWLTVRIASFVQARIAKRTSTWFPQTYDAFLHQWPVAKPTAQQLKAANGDMEKARRAVLKKAKRRVYWWYINHTRGLGAGTDQRGVLDLTSNKKKILPAYQAYLKVYGPRVTPIIEERWATYLAELREGQRRVARVKFQTQTAIELLAAEPKEIRDRVEHLRNNLDELEAEVIAYQEDADGEGNELTPDERLAVSKQESIECIARTLQLVLENLEKQTGWVATVLCGGPNAVTGKITTASFSTGRTLTTNYPFIKMLSGWSEVVESYHAFVGKCVDPEAMREFVETYARAKDRMEPQELDEDVEMVDEGQPTVPSSSSQAGVSGGAAAGAASSSKVTGRVASGASSSTNASSGAISRASSETGEAATSAAGSSSNDKPSSAAERGVDASLVDNGLAGVPTAPAATATPSVQPCEPSQPAGGHVQLDGAAESGGAAAGAPGTAIPGGPTPEASPVKKKPAPKPRGKAKAQAGGPTLAASPSSPSSPVSVDMANPNASQPVSEASAPSTSEHEGVPTSNKDASPVAVEASPPGAPTSPATSIDSSAAATSPTALVDPPSAPAAPAYPSASIDTSEASSLPQPSNASESLLREGSAESNVSVTGAGKDLESTSKHVAPERTLKLPGWMTDVVQHLRGVSDDGAWQSLVDIWIRFELLLDSPGGVRGLSTSSRPEAVAVWMKYGRKLAKAPTIDPTQFGRQWKAWWSALQPAWRDTAAWPFDRTISGDEDWHTLRWGRSNGVFLVILSLSWWLTQEDAGTLQTVNDAVQDVCWVLGSVVHQGKVAAPSVQSRSGPSKRRSADEGPQKRRKRARV